MGERESLVVSLRREEEDEVCDRILTLSRVPLLLLLLLLLLPKGLFRLEVEREDKVELTLKVSCVVLAWLGKELTSTMN